LGRLLRRVFGSTLLAIGLLAAGAALLLGGRILFYGQEDDADRVAAKRDYLERIAEGPALPPSSPNLVLILFDDLGHGDIGAYGGTAIRTPNLDRLAAEGLLFRDAYAPSPYCSASRAGLLTGRYAVRAGLDHVLQAPWTWKDCLERLGGLNRRLPAEEITLAEVVQAAGYATAIVGKWHLGDQSPSLPNDMGFDSFYGMLFSNDQGQPRVWQDREVAERHPIDLTTLTRRYTEQAVRFVEANRDRPFFLYLPHTFPHVPLQVAQDRLGRSPGGLYGDVVEELDWSTGELLAALERVGVDERTLVVVSSDNGPWFQGSPGENRGRKFDVFEGGMRVPLLARWPGRIPAGRVDEEPVVSVDLFPTMLELLGLPLPADRVIEGQSVLARLEGRPAEPHPPIWFHQIGLLLGVREGPFKYHARHQVPFGMPVDWPFGIQVRKGPWLFDLRSDPDESYDVSARHPEVRRRLEGMLEARRQELQENLRGWR
jgi:uncharacterized sulfatase